MEKTQLRYGIPRFGLYGESSVSQDPGFVHIEDIAARSREIGWVIKPHRHANLFQILCMFAGELEVQLDDQKHVLSGAWAMTIPPGVVHGFRFQPDTKGAVLTLAEPLLADARGQQTRRYFDALTHAARIIEFSVGGVLFDQLRNCLNLITAEFQQAETGYEQMLEWQVGMVLMTLRRQFDNGRFLAELNKPGSNVLREFRTLLEKKYRKQWRVQQYAAALHTSVSSLNRRCNEWLGIPAKAIIQNRLLIEAKRKLIYTQYPVDHIAYTLGFKDPAYFSRFFKKSEGVPPVKYRQANNNGTTTEKDNSD